MLILSPRETKEECGLDVIHLDKVGVLLYEDVNEPQILEVHMFRTTQFSGEVTESEGIHSTVKAAHRAFCYYCLCY